MLTSRCGIILIFVFMLAPFQKAYSQDLTPFNSNITAVKSYSGLHVAAFNVNNGQLKIYLPGDMAVSDTVSGSVNFEFYELDSGELVNRKFDISDYSLEIEHKKIDIEGENFKFVVPYNLPAGVLNVELHNKSGDMISRAFFPVRLTRQNRYGNNMVDPSNFRIPITGRSGLPVKISGPFDGDYKTTKISIAGKSVLILAESPRTLIFRSPEDINGTRVIAIREGDVNVKNTFTNLNVVHVGNDQSYYRSSISNNSKSAEKIRRGEFIIESDEVDQTLSQSGRVPVPAVAPVTTAEAENNESVSSVPKTEISDNKPATGKKEKSNMTNSVSSGEVKEKDSSEVTDQANEKVEKKVDNSGKKSNNSTEGDATENIKDIYSINDYLEKQYHARVSVSSSDLVKNKTEEKKAKRTNDVIRSESYKDINNDNKPEKRPAQVETNKNIQQKQNGPGFVIQLASVKNQQDADKLVEKIKLKGYNAYSVRAAVPGKGHWFRIRIGGFTSRQEAMDYKSGMKLDGININRKSIFITEDK